MMHVWTSLTYPNQSLSLRANIQTDIHQSSNTSMETNDIYVNWNADLNAIFDVPLLTSCPKKKQRKKCLSTHRLLTSEEIINKKLEAAESKIKKEKEKEERKRIRMEKQSKLQGKKRDLND